MSGTRAALRFLGGVLAGTLLMAWVWLLLFSLPPGLIVLAQSSVGGAAIAVALPLAGAYHFGAGAVAGWVSGRLEEVAATGSALSMPVLLGAASVLGGEGLPGPGAALICGYLATLAALGGLTVRLGRRRARPRSGGSV